MRTYNAFVGGKIQVEQIIGDYHCIVATILDGSISEKETLIRTLIRLRDDVLYCSVYNRDIMELLPVYEIGIVLMRWIKDVVEDKGIVQCFASDVVNLDTPTGSAISILADIWVNGKSDVSTTATDNGEFSLAVIESVAAIRPDAVVNALQIMNCVGMCTVYFADIFYFYRPSGMSMLNIRNGKVSES